MDECQRSVLQRHFKQLANDLILSEDLLGDLYQEHIFDRNMIDIIRSQGTDSDRVYKMLEMLPKRGPSAFDTFISIIQDSYPWLAAMLESSYLAEKSKHQPGSSRQHGKLERLFSIIETPQHTEKTDSDIRKRVGTFVHKQFGQSKRVSQNDKKALEKFLNEQLHDERIRLQSLAEKPESLAETETESVVSQVSDVHQKLFEIHVILEPHLKGKARKDFSNLLPEDMTFDIIQKEIRCILENLNRAEEELTKCLKLPGLYEDEDDSLTLCLYVEKLIEKAEDQQEKLHTQETRLTELQSELNEYSIHIHKLESERTTSRSKIELLAKEVSQLRHDKFKLDERNAQLEKIHQQHLEKEKTLENLKSVVKELQASKNNSSSGYIEDGVNVRSREVNGLRNSIVRRTFRTTGERFGRAAPKPTHNYQLARTRYTVRSTTKKKPNLPV
ncbi:putative leucine-rich repeat-containing protein DDB_G0290503 [Haliotis asinina]|uniref:putative leucine-rich repeat-containing protein DDB_G0290503 n=1 Tax=Haliotis asinina TaxID=109174 RepID=UPI00353228D3